VTAVLLSALTTPLAPDDYIGLVRPLWSRRQLRGRVESVRPETVDAATVVIRPGRGWRGHRAGQYVRLGVGIDGVWQWRAYSLSSAPGGPDGPISITVKAGPGGRVSQYLVHRIEPGTTVRLEHPQGRFVLPPATPRRLLFLTAGSGITPVMSMVRGFALRREIPDIVLIHSAPTGNDVIFGAELRRLAGRYPTLRVHEHYTRAPGGGRLTMRKLSTICPDWSERPAWACGPPGLLEAAEAHWRQAGISDQLRVERFHLGVVRGGAGGRVRFVRSGRMTTADGDTPLLVVGENTGVLMPSGCRTGICRSCLARLASGRVRDLRTGLEHGDEGDVIQTCVSAAAGDVDIDL